MTMRSMSVCAVTVLLFSACLTQRAIAQLCTDAEFLADPDRYAPVLSGIDPVLAIDTGQQVGGFRRHGVFFGDKIFLFSSEDSLTQFTQDPSRYAEGVRQAIQRTDSQLRR